MASPNPGLLAALLKTGRLTGVLRWKVNLTNEHLKIEANIAKWIGYFLNLSDSKSLEDCFALISTEFDLPKLNLANFVQLISEKFQQQKNTGDQKILLAISGWQELVKNSSTDAQSFVSLLEEIAENLPGLVLFVDSKGEYPDIALLTSA